MVWVSGAGSDDKYRIMGGVDKRLQGKTFHQGGDSAVSLLSGKGIVGGGDLPLDLEKDAP